MYALFSFKTYRLLFASIFLLLAACQPSIASPSPLVILPANCEVPASGQVGLTLNGDVDPSAQVKWDANFGSIVENGRGFSATYFAPTDPGEDRIVATIAPSLSGGSETLSVTCRITTADGSQPPSATITTSFSSAPTIAVSEVMAHVCE